MASNIRTMGRVRFKGLQGGKNASAVALAGERAYVVADELTDRGNVVQVFEADGDDFRPVLDEAIVLEAKGMRPREMDLEGLAAADDALFVLGSHSARRRKVDADEPYARNRDALMSKADPQPSRDVLFRIGRGTDAGIVRTTLRGLLNKTEPFTSFRRIPSKENGIDAEGLAFWRDRLYIGFRGPVLRGNFTPVIRCRFGVPVTDPEVLFVSIGGLGVRDLAATDDRLLVLAGPVGDGPGAYRLYAWDGRDCVPGDGAPTSRHGPGLTLLGELPDAGDAAGSAAKAEGLTVARESAHHWDVIVVYDGLKNGHGMRMRVEKP